jgi:hypothetical protein
MVLLVSGVCLLVLGTTQGDLLQAALQARTLLLLIFAALGFSAVAATHGTLVLTDDSQVELGGRSFGLADLADIEYQANGQLHTVLRYRDERGKLTTLSWSASAADRHDFIDRVRRCNPAVAVRRHEVITIAWNLGMLEWPRAAEAAQAAMRCLEPRCQEAGAYRCYTCAEVRCRTHLYVFQRGGEDEWPVCRACSPKLGLSAGVPLSMAETVGPGCSQPGCWAWRSGMFCGWCNRSFCVLHVEWVDLHNTEGGGHWQCRDCAEGEILHERPS